MEIIKKAWCINSDCLEEPWYCPDDIIYAETSGKAKIKAINITDGHNDKEGEDLSFLSIRVRRVKSMDILKVDGREIKRSSLLFEKKVSDRIKKLNSLPEKEMFYVQDSRNYVGNSVLWWALNNNGYTTDISKAQKYSKADILNRFKDARETDIIWIASHVESNIKQHVDSQYLNREWSR